MPTPKQNERSNRLLQVALREFCKHGFRESSIDVIAKKANVSKGTIYHHFDNKKELFISAFNLIGSRVVISSEVGCMGYVFPDQWGQRPAINLCQPSLLTFWSSRRLVVISPMGAAQAMQPS